MTAPNTPTHETHMDEGEVISSLGRAGVLSGQRLCPIRGIQLRAGVVYAGALLVPGRGGLRLGGQGRQAASGGLFPHRGGAAVGRRRLGGQAARKEGKGDTVVGTQTGCEREVHMGGSQHFG